MARPPPGGGGAHLFQQGPQGRLVFEDDHGQPDPKTAEQLGTLLRDHRIPAIVLNACQSAMISNDADDVFASVATSLLRAGVRSVVAMAYSLYVSAAQQFLPAFYGRLFANGSFAEAARAGRQQLLAEPGRVCARGKHPLEDWLVPVLYQQQPVELQFGDAAASRPHQTSRELPQELRDDENPYGFIGRDGVLLELERAMLRKPAGILIHGLGGVGKTTLARGFLRWLFETGGLENGMLWFRFDEGLRSAESVLNRMGEAVLRDPNFATAGLEQRVESLTDALRENRRVIIWDNFEVVRGMEASGISPTLSSDDQQLLLRLLKELRGGKTKVLITSRSEEDWLGSPNRFKVSLGGLQGEEIWEYSETILSDLGLHVDRNDKALGQLMKVLDGHPLAMRVVLSKLENRSAADLLQTLESNLDAFAAGDGKSEQILFATLRFVEDALPKPLRELLVPLALHERFVDPQLLGAIAKRANTEWTLAQINELLGVLEHAGLVIRRGQRAFEIHPLLGRYLRACKVLASAEAWERAFVDVLSSLADELTALDLHKQRMAFFIHIANFGTALALAKKLGIAKHLGALLQSLGSYAINTRNFSDATRMFTQLCACHERRGDEAGRAGACHALGRIAQEQRDFQAAERWYSEALKISENLGKEDNAAITCHQLGAIAELQRDLDKAERWYHKALAVFERLEIEHHAAGSYHQLGRITESRGDLEAAKGWFHKALAIKEKHGNEHTAASTYQHLGNIAVQQQDFDAATKWYQRALAIDEKQRDEHGMAGVYHGLGIVAQERGDFETAESCFRKSLSIKEKLGDKHYSASSYAQLGILAGRQGHWMDAAAWLIKSIKAFRHTGDDASAKRVTEDLVRFCKQADPTSQKRMQEMWEEAGLGTLPEVSE